MAQPTSSVRGQGDESLRERVVYFLGAGFGAPFGLPVIANFVACAKDQHHLRGVGGDHFEQVFRAISDLSRVKNQYSADLTNIEEVLSILEMDAFLGDKALRRAFEQFIVDVIAHYTPRIGVARDGMAASWNHRLFEWDNQHNELGIFTAALQLLRFQETGGVVHGERIVTAPVHYDVVTTNYDLLLESAVAYMRSRSMVVGEVGFRRIPEDSATLPVLAKLHGSIDGGSIVPPTWSKAADPAILPRWKLARDVLARAQHIRVLGYSLPEADSYVRYLLKSAALQSEHLKTIDVLTLDPHGDVEKRYRAFIAHAPFRFVNVDLRAYLSEMAGDVRMASADRVPACYEALERVHEVIMNRYRGRAA